MAFGWKIVVVARFGCLLVWYIYVYTTSHRCRVLVIRAANLVIVSLPTLRITLGHSHMYSRDSGYEEELICLIIIAKR